MEKFNVRYSIQQKLIIGFSLVLFLAWFFVGLPFVNQISQDDLREYSNVGPQKVYDIKTNKTVEGQQAIFVKDKIISEDGRNLIINSNSVGTDRYTGEVFWNATTTYVVDKFSRKNVPKVMDGIIRDGYFMFPSNVGKKNYSFNSPEVLEKEGTLIFVSEEEFSGVKVYRFNYSLENLDKTLFFPLIPNGYRVIGEHKGTILVEPKSGVIVNFEHSGINRLYDNQGKYVVDYEVWENSFNDATISNQMNLAGKIRNRNLYLTILNWAIGLIIVFVLFYYLVVKKRRYTK